MSRFRVERQKEKKGFRVNQSTISSVSCVAPPPLCPLLSSSSFAVLFNRYDRKDAERIASLREKNKKRTKEIDKRFWSSKNEGKGRSGTDNEFGIRAREGRSD